MTYDAIVVGARAGGSSTAMLLARKGLRVLALDRATFPSDTLSTHQVQVPGGASLARWGLLERIVAAGTPAARHVRFDQGSVVLEGDYPSFEGVDAVYSPRRTLLDDVLVNAAREAGAEVRENVDAEGLVWDGDRVVGVRMAEKGGSTVTESARIVIGADGRRSKVAEWVDATISHETPPRTLACYAYWSGVELDGGRIYGRDRRMFGVWPTNDGLVLTYVAWPIDEFERFRADVEGNVLSTLDLAGDLGERVRAGERAERIRTTPETLNRVRVPFGEGWALVGDAGLVMDPITGQGIGDAFHDAELLTDAIEQGLGGSNPLSDTLAIYHATRDRDVLPMYEFTVELAALDPPPPEARVLFESLVGRQAEIDRFLGVLTGSVSMSEYFSPRNLRKVIGLRGIARVMVGKIRGEPPRSGVASEAA